jgi:DNA-directed RNA polymerase specialized sigma24 family protein
VILDERRFASIGNVGHFIIAVEAGSLAAPIIQWLPLLPAAPRAELSAWVSSCRGNMLGLYAAAHHGTEEEGSLLDRMSDGRVPLVREDFGWLHQSLARLSDQARRVLALRYGGDDLRSLSQVADRMGLTKSTVQGLEQRALRELRGSLHPSQRRELRCSLSA